MSAAVADAITNGQPDGDGHPYVAVLVDDFVTPGYCQRFCTGTLVAPRIVVTAAHCLLGVVDTEIWVSFDSIYRPGISPIIHGTGIAAVDPVIFHGQSGAGAQFGNSALGNDIAVVHLDADAPITQFAQLPTADLLSALDLTDRTFTAVGYGQTRADKTKGPNHIEPNIDPDVRNVSIEAFRNLRAGVITVSGNPATGQGGTCNGDSGGPHFLGDSSLMIALTIEGDIACRSTGRHYKLDTPFARELLAAQGVPVP
jgi:secreted trypsin-like serine protease